MGRDYSRQKLVNYIVDQLETGKSVSRLAKRVAAYLIDVGRISELDSVMRDAQEIRAQKYGVVELTVRSANPLNSAQSKQVERVAAKQYGKVKKVTIHKIDDESVVGGANLTLPHTSLDLTVRAKLNQLREGIS